MPSEIDLIACMPTLWEIAGINTISSKLRSETPVVHSRKHATPLQGAQQAGSEVQIHWKDGNPLRIRGEFSVLFCFLEKHRSRSQRGQGVQVCKTE